MGVEQSQRAEGRIPTEHPARYLAQLRTRTGVTGTAAQQEEHAAWSDTHGTIEAEGGRCTLQAGPGSLTLRVEAADRGSLRRIQHLVTGRLREIGGPEAPEVTWQPAAAATPRPRRRGTKLGIAAVAVLVVAAHLGLGGLLLTSGPWKHWALGALLAVLLAKAVHLLRRRAGRRGKARRHR
ncbi:DUF2218 domain-containing protein [Streptomyces sp. NPDC005722]